MRTKPEFVRITAGHADEIVTAFMASGLSSVAVSLKAHTLAQDDPRRYEDPIADAVRRMGGGASTETVAGVVYLRRAVRR